MRSKICTYKRAIVASIALLLVAAVSGSAQASPTVSGGPTRTSVGAEACRAYANFDAPLIQTTAWGIRNIGAGPVWVVCPVVGQQVMDFALDGTNARALLVVGYSEDPLLCQHRVQFPSGAAIETKTETMVNNAPTTPFEFAYMTVPSDPTSWTIASTATKSALWCRLPPGAFLYDYHMQEDDI